MKASNTHKQKQGRQQPKRNKSTWMTANDSNANEWAYLEIWRTKILRTGVWVLFAADGCKGVWPATNPNERSCGNEARTCESREIFQLEVSPKTIPRINSQLSQDY